MPTCVWLPPTRFLSWEFIRARLCRRSALPRATQIRASAPKQAAECASCSWQPNFSRLRRPHLLRPNRRSDDAVKYLPRVFRYLRPYWALAVASVGLIFVSGLTELLNPWPLKVLVDHALGNHPPPAWLAALVGSATERHALLIVAVVSGLIIALLHNGLAVLTNYVNTRLEQRMVLDFRSDLFQHA